MLTTRRRVRRVVPALLAALALSLGMARANVAAAHPEAEGKPLPAPREIHLTRPKLINAHGHAEPKKVHKDLGLLPTVPREKLAELKAAAAKHAEAHRPEATGGNSARMPAQPSRGSFEGLSRSNPDSLRPDTHGAVGKGHFVEVTNDGIGVFSKSDGTLVKKVSLAGFFDYDATDLYEPRALYDRKWNRWIVSAVAFPETATAQRLFYAVSVTSNPAGSYYVYSFTPPKDAGDFYDFSQVGLDQDALIATVNFFHASETETDYIGSRAFGPAKADLYNGRDTTFRYWDLGTPGTIAPPVVEDDNSSVFLVAAAPSDNRLSLFKATGLGRSDETVEQRPDVPVPAYTVPPSARQPGTDGLLDSGDSRFANNSTQVGNQLLNVHTVDNSGFPTPRWYQIGTDTGTLTTGGEVYESPDSDDFNVSVAGSPVGGTMDNPIGRMFFSWSSTNALSSPHQVRVKSGGRLATDNANVIGGNTHSTASTFYDPVPSDLVEYWGAYSSVTINPSSTGTCPAGSRAYVVNERQISTTDWGSRIGRLGSC